MSDRDVFLSALDIADPAARAAFLDRSETDHALGIRRTEYGLLSVWWD